MIELDVIDPKSADREEPSERFWRSLPQLERKTSGDGADTPTPEFSDGASEPPSKASRRQFLQLMGAAMAMAGLTACRRPDQRILPYARKPEDVIPGIPQHFATGMPFRGSLRPLLVESHEGRPTKVEGNPDHPGSNGGTSPFEQASVLNLYDPDRSRSVWRDGSKAEWADFKSFCVELANRAANQELAILMPTSSSPTLEAMLERARGRFGSVRVVEYATEGNDNARLGMQQAFGRPYRAQYDFEQSDVVLSLDADFLDGKSPDFLNNNRTFFSGRRVDSVDDDMNRLYVVESQYSTTGGTADHRLRMKASVVSAFAATVAAEMGLGTAPDYDWSEKEAVHAREIARDLQEAGSRGVVVAGETQPPEVHALAMAINERLGAIGNSVMLLDTGVESVEAQDEELATLVDDMNAGRVGTVLMMGVNPVYDAPAGLNFREALQRVDNTIHVGLRRNETARASRWHLPRAHYLEAWGDGRTFDGTLSVIQPLIAPLYSASHSEIEVLNLLGTGMDESGYDLVRDTWRGQISGSFEEGWRRVLHDGYLADSAYPTASPGSASVPSIDTPSDDGLEVIFRLDPSVLDGSYGNNAWMQELPDPVTKITWDNVAVMSAATAADLGLSADGTYDEGQENGYSEGNFFVDRVNLTIDGETINIPVWVQPGLPDGTIGLTHGYGRAISTTRDPEGTPFWDTDNATDVYFDGPIAGGVGSDGEPVNSVGVRTSHLRPSGSRIATGATVEKASSGYMIATTQETGSMHGRAIVRWGSLEEFRNNPEFVKEETEPVPGDEYDSFEEFPELWAKNHPSEAAAMKDSNYFDNQWGMVIDLNTCTGCNACVVACTSENNVQVVGKESVSNGRHMYWLRMDRYYYSGEDDREEPEMMMQPVMCQHCENAPCESVCPVAATVHSPDGTNQMIYNRCIGTRYCSNNCPYKVRRFNFFNWTKTLPQEVKMAQNPNVTVRSRGVMEKCSWCVHRIRDNQHRANQEERDLRADEIQTACQQACPTEAITFGDLNNPESSVVEKRKNPRRYELLSYLNVKPRLSYLGRVRNVNPRIQEALGLDMEEGPAAPESADEPETAEATA
ncbi:hydrogenase [Longibacter salinarum]|uniref:Hydrogenase n=1 Tax=Longibacter salinarum TaxID=1850348 RepID=A0A2A8D0A8_9BACT|nr:Fe-S cluster-containing hydrogenase [Longibacter salinarum]PEN14356.1 hydrogenase [Longibacter salinarum]